MTFFIFFGIECFTFYDLDNSNKFEIQKVMNFQESSELGCVLDLDEYG